MKKSELIQKLEDELDCITTMSQIHSDDVSWLANNIMELLEKVGMTPPPYVAVFATGKKCVHNDDFARDTILTRSWEPEENEVSHATK